MRAAVLIAIATAACSGDEPPAPRGDAAVAPKPRRPLPAVPSPVEAARTAVARGCDRGDTKACVGLGRLDEACLHGDARGCMLAANSDPDKTRLYQARACRRGLSSACELAGAVKKPYVSGRGLGVYEHAVADCWAETAGVDRAVTVRGTIAVTTDHRGKTTAIARIPDPALRRCIESSAARWVFDDNRDIDLLIRPLDRAYGSALGSLSGGGMIGAMGSGPATRWGGTGTLGGLGSFGARPVTRLSIAVDQLDGYPKADVARRLRARYSALMKSCHQRMLLSDPDLEADVVVRFTITPTGSIDDISATSKGPDRLRQCVKRRARIWRFDPPRDSSGQPESARFSARITFRVK